MIEAFDNPPLTSYYLALAATVAGWSEIALHLAFLLPAIAAVLGTYTLAKNYCDRPMLAAGVALLTPLFLISGTTIMCDMMLVAFWVWAEVFFEKGLQSGSKAAFFVSGCLAGLAVLTKFSGLSLMPLMVAHGVFKLRRPGWWVIAPLLPVLFAAGYEWLTFRMYGHGLLTYAATYTSKFRAATQGHGWENIILGVGFMGGCFLPMLFYAPWLWSRRVILAGIVLTGACLIGLPYLGKLAKLLWLPEGGINWATLLLCAVFTVGGIQLLLLPLADVWKRCDPLSMTLLCWVFGVAVFDVGINWTVTARGFLPMAPALGILVARRLEKNHDALLKPNLKTLLWPALAAAAVSLILVKADYELANTGRKVAQNLMSQYAKGERTVWFAGHWGFQYYMEKLGAKPVETPKPAFKHGDVVIYPNHGSNIGIPDLSVLTLVTKFTFIPNSHVATMNPAVGAGFYASVMGPLPFAVGRLEPEIYLVYEVK
jgi:4-amino-4-deoxy-L-arabinose transferase-like glycosyltransferase